MYAPKGVSSSQRSSSADGSSFSRASAGSASKFPDLPETPSTNARIPSSSLPRRNPARDGWIVSPLKPIQQIPSPGTSPEEGEDWRFAENQRTRQIGLAQRQKQCNVGPPRRTDDMGGHDLQHAEHRSKIVCMPGHRVLRVGTVGDVRWMKTSAVCDGPIPVCKMPYGRCKVEECAQTSVNEYKRFALALFDAGEIGSPRMNPATDRGKSPDRICRLAHLTVWRCKKGALGKSVGRAEKHRRGI
jgi:hypothetical protein